MSTVFSIIIPHHNIPGLLRRCLDSVPRRDDTEVLVVDDGSDAACQRELEHVAADYPWVRFIMCKECKGGGVARNVGIEQAKGRYLVFADADDFFNVCINDVMDDYKNSSYDTIYLKANSVDSVTYETAGRADHLNRYIEAFLSGKDPEGKALRYLFGEPWARIVSSRLVNDNQIRFDEIKVHNDTTFAYLTGYYSKNIHIDTREAYCVTVRSKSVSQQVSHERAYIRMRVFGKAEFFLAERGIGVRPVEHYHQLLSLLAHGEFRVFVKCVRILRGESCGYYSILTGMCQALKATVINKL